MNELIATVASGSKRLIALGVIAMILGVFALMAPALTGVSITMLLGLLVVGGGIVRMIWAFSTGSIGSGLLMFALGGLTLLCGIVLLANPLLASGVLTIVLVAYFIGDGVSEIVAGVQRRSVSGRGWLLFGGIVSILLGCMMWAQFPLSGAWAMGALLGIKLFLTGLIIATGGSALRSMAKAA
jgi:uncharacterized membrane protein HdeD (DUF308 family)